MGFQIGEFNGVDTVCYKTNILAYCGRYFITILVK